MQGKYVFDKRWFMTDFARLRTFERDEIILWLDKLSELGYNGLGVYIEGAFAFESIKGVIRHGVITKEDALWLCEEGKKRDIFVFPMTNVVGHMEHFFRQERFAELSDSNAPLFQLNFLDEKAEKFAMNIVHEFTSAFPCGIVHIGGDETTLTDENKVSYAKFLAKICKNLLNEGIQPGIWSDMLWMNGELAEHFDRRVSIFDWNYYGHRPESIAFFKECGFEDIVVCPSDNGCSGFINYQHPDGWNRARADIPVKPYEVEMFFEDGRSQGVMNGLLTSWENETGRNMWAQWSAFARAGLYMSGKIKAGEEHENEKIEKALFGRITPYTEITRELQTIQEKIREKNYPFPYFVWPRSMRVMLFTPSVMITFYKDMKRLNADFFLSYQSDAHRLSKKLDTWTPEGDFEKHCYAAMRAVLAILKASGAVSEALYEYHSYASAAKLQFENPSACSQKLFEISAKFRLAKAELDTAAAVHGEAIKSIGHSKTDIERMRITSDTLENIAEKIEELEKQSREIPLPRFDYLLDCVINRKFMF